MKISFVGEGKVILVEYTKHLTSLAGKLNRTERSILDLADSEYNPDILDHLRDYGHYSPFEFDRFTFMYEGYSRVCEAQLTRHRMASFMIKSGRAELSKREYSLVLPASLKDNLEVVEKLEAEYNKLKASGIKEEDLRYIKPQATESKGIFQMNVRSLYNFFGLRCCKNAQEEIRDMAYKMLKLCKDVAPDLFKKAGPRCVQLGYCPEGANKNDKCNVITTS